VAPALLQATCHDRLAAALDHPRADRQVTAPTFVVPHPITIGPAITREVRLGLVLVRKRLELLNHLLDRFGPNKGLASFGSMRLHQQVDAAIGSPKLWKTGHPTRNPNASGPEFGNRTGHPLKSFPFADPVEGNAEQIPPKADRIDARTFAIFGQAFGIKGSRTGP